MANASNSGGGYRKGDGAQEENIFRRSDYFRSLDVDFDESRKQRTDRFHCSSNCQLDPLSDHKSMYPMDEFGALYKSGLNIFRRPEDTGYPLMEKHLANVCSLAMAAYRGPRLEGKMLAHKYAIGTLTKFKIYLLLPTITDMIVSFCQLSGVTHLNTHPYTLGDSFVLLLNNKLAFSNRLHLLLLTIIMQIII